ncbi:hypothetical protein [Pseudonocardia endophytica]|uniref:DUF732 domain-containing protein n=1 Tax=Pseudonocardia endophytica TaxID=401976 RepID=A0A4R1HL51_PSEEN|nr:hypothetical protein [Pseudonocardia endophytica]TCK22688.1 hypothetical protein EV378_6696 [Pseudonocardia endophytica]
MPKTSARVLVGFVLFSSVFLAGCPGGVRAGAQVGDDVAREVRVLAGAGREIPLPKPRVTVAPVELTPLADRVAVQTESIVAPHVDDLEIDDARQVVSAACTANDVADLYGAESWEDAADTALGMTNSPAGARQRVASLASDIDDAESSSDIATSVAAYAICETT